MRKVFFNILFMAGLVAAFHSRPSVSQNAFASSRTFTTAVSDTPFVKVPHRKFEFPCEACHTTESWKVIKSAVDFDHTRTASRSAARMNARIARDVMPAGNSIRRCVSARSAIKNRTWVNWGLNANDATMKTPGPHPYSAITIRRFL